MGSRLQVRHRAVASMAVVLFVLSSGALSLVVSAQSAPLNLVSTAWPPFTNAAGQPRFALDLVEAALGRIGVEAKTTLVNAPDFTSSLLTGPFDGSAAAWKDAERERVLLFSQPYLENRLVLVGRSGGDVSAKALSDLTGRRVAIVEGYSYGEATQGAGPVFVRSTSEEDSLARLLKGEVDYTLMDELVVQYILKNHPREAEARLAIGSTPLVTRQLYFALRRSRPDAESIISRFNAQLRGMMADGTYHRLLNLEWIRADVNGDGVPEYVPVGDRTGPSEPQRAYSIFSTGPALEAPAKSGFYVGGNIYGDWGSVPDIYKATSARSSAPPPMDPRRTATLFKFTW